MRVLVTGSKGFIGKATVKALEASGHEAQGFDLSDGQDIENAEQVRAAMDGCHAVIHLAGKLGTAELFDDPIGAVRANVVGTTNVLTACVPGKKRFVGITMPQTGWRSLYQATKLSAEAIAESFRQHCGVPVAHVRAFNAYGEGQKLGPVQKIIPTFAAAAWDRKPIPIWGNGQQLVDLIHVDQVARALADSAVREFAQPCVTNAGTGTGLSVLYVAEKVCEFAGAPFLVEFLPMRKGESADGQQPVANTEDFPFEHEALRRTVEWYRDNRPA